MYDLIILGGGPAGTAAAVYSARKQLKTAIVAYLFEGQSVVSEKIYNWIGTPEISGGELSHSLKKHIDYYRGEYLDIIEGEKISNILKQPEAKSDLVGSPDASPKAFRGSFKIQSESGKEFFSRTIIIATGSGRRKLEAINADKFDNKGIVYCASCDGPLFADQDVVVVGGGNAAFETSAQLLSYCKSVTLINRSENFRADKITIKKVKENPKFSIIANAIITKVDGEQFVNSLTYKDTKTEIEHDIQTTGIFVEIGQIPNVLFAKGLVELDEIGKIKVDPMTQSTSVPGIWAAGDCTNGRYHQNNIAAGDAVKALEDAYMWLHRNK